MLPNFSSLISHMHRNFVTETSSIFNECNSMNTKQSIQSTNRNKVKYASHHTNDVLGLTVLWNMLLLDLLAPRSPIFTKLVKHWAIAENQLDLSHIFMNISQCYRWISKSYLCQFFFFLH